VPSREGVSIPAGLENIYALLDGLLYIVAEGEGKDIINKYAEQLLNRPGD
jgi:hypothetical protein